LPFNGEGILSFDWSGIEQIDFQLDLKFLDDHCRFIDSVIQKKQKSFRIRVENKFVTENYDTEAYYLFELFPTIQWSAMFVAAYNIFEKNLNDVCNCVRGATGTQAELKKSDGSGIERAKNYLSKAYNLAEPFTKKEWSRIKKLSEIRNILAHTSGQLDLSNAKHKNILHLIEREKYINVKSYNAEFQSAEVFVDKQAVYDAILIYRNFLLSLLKAIYGLKN
jgi:hypothetical protein